MSAALLLTALIAGQLPEVPPPSIELAAFERPPYRVALPVKWRYRAGDDPAYAAPDFDDSAWPQVETLLNADDIPEDLGRVAWFRLQLDIPPELIGKPMMLAFLRIAALEIYVDGQRVGEVGELQSVLRGGSTDVSLAGDAVTATFHRDNPLVAVRLASPDVRAAARGGWPGGFMGFIGPSDIAREYRAKETRGYYILYFVFIGMCIALFMLHLLLFFFMPSQRANLHYALSTLSVGLMSFFLIKRISEIDFEMFLLSGYGFLVSLVGLAIFGVRYCHAIVNTQHGLLRRIFIGLGVLLVLTGWWLPVEIAYVYSCLALLEQVRTIIVGIVRKVRDIWIVAVGLIVAAVMSLIQMLPFIIGAEEPWLENAYVYGFLALLLSMSIYLARSIAHTHADLARRLIEVRDLSDAAIAQERRVKSEEMRRVMLEEENKRQSMELDEAKKRQEVLTQLERTNRELRDAQAQLVQSEKMAALGQLVAGIAHEINTPIGAVHSMHDSLERATRKLTSILEKKAPELIEGDRKLRATLKVIDDATQVIESGSSRVAQIVQRLKTFARLDEAQMQRASLEAGMEDTLLLLHHELKRAVTVVRDYGEVPAINCYPGQLNQVFLNLLVNARQAVSESGVIRVRTRLVDDEVHVSVIDDGCGIPQDNLSRVFDPGFTTKGVKVGTGLGLAICYQIVQQHRGRIDVTSEVGVGTTFTVVLPTNLEEDAAGPQNGGSPDSPPEEAPTSGAERESSEN